MSKPKPTYLYILERTAKKSLWAKITAQCEVKIGISTDVTKRLKSINKSVKGKVELSYSTVFKKAYKVEQNLHRLFSDSNFRMRRNGNKSNGETEWFYMNWLEMVVLFSWIWYYKNEGSFWFCLIILGLFGYELYVDYLNDIVDHREILLKWGR